MQITFVFDLSINTDQEKFDQKEKENGLPFHDMSKVNWKKFTKQLRKLILCEVSKSRKRHFTVDVWPDCLDSASKPLLSNKELMQEWKNRACALLDGKKDIITIIRHRLDFMYTDYFQSSPPQEITFSVSFPIVGNFVYLFEELFTGIQTHFNAKTTPTSQACDRYLFNRNGTDPSVSLTAYENQSLSAEMLNLLCETFDNPFANDIYLTVFNEPTVRNFDPEKY